MSAAWRCAAHDIATTGDCPRCDAEQIADLDRYVQLPVCRECGRTLEDDEYAWADDVKVIEPDDGVRVEIRYTCDRCCEVAP